MGRADGGDALLEQGIPVQLEAKPMLTLDKIIGRTPKELWELYDADVTRQVKYLEGRMGKECITESHL